MYSVQSQATQSKSKINISNFIDKRSVFNYNLNVLNKSNSQRNCDMRGTSSTSQRLLKSKNQLQNNRQFLNTASSQLRSIANNLIAPNDNCTSKQLSISRRSSINQNHNSRQNLALPKTAFNLGNSFLNKMCMSRSQTQKSLIGVNTFCLPIGLDERLQTPQNIVFNENNSNRAMTKTMTKEEKLNLLKLKKEETALKIKSKLDIYSSVRPFKDDKQKERATQEYYQQLNKQKRQPLIEHLYSTQKFIKSSSTDRSLLTQEHTQSHGIKSTSRNSPLNKNPTISTNPQTNNDEIPIFTNRTNDKSVQLEMRKLSIDLNRRYSNSNNSDYLEQLQDLNITQAVLNNDVNALINQLQKRSFQEKRKIINQRDNNERSLLFYAVYKNQFDICKILLQNGAETLIRDHLERSILHIACIRNCEQRLLQLILENKNAQDREQIHLKRIYYESNKGKNYDQIHLYNLIKSQQSSEMNSFKSQDNLKIALDQIIQESQDMNLKSQDEKIRQKIEIQLKTSQAYKQQTCQFINFTDKYGKTALHYAVHFDHIDLVKFLIINEATPFIRDHKGRIPLDLAKSSEIKCFLLKQYEIQKELILAKQKQRQLMRLNTTSTSISSQYSRFSNLTLFGKAKLSQNLDLASLESFAQYSNQQLSQYSFGLYQDNALTYMIRVDNKEKFIYFLNRGILPSTSDQQGCNALHYAIRMNRLDYLSYMFEGDFHAFEQEEPLQNFQTSFSNCSFNRSQFHLSQSVISTSISPKKKNNYMIDSLLMLDKSSFHEGITLFHEACKHGHLQILQYLFQVLKSRNLILETQLKTSKNQPQLQQMLKEAKTVKQILEFTDQNNTTLLLQSVISNYEEIVKYLINEGANVYTHCTQLQNPLHYAVINGNENLIKFLLQADAESSILSNQRNIKNLKPEQLDTENKFAHLFNNQWELISQNNPRANERLIKLYQKNICKLEEKTEIGQNTVLHFAILYNNVNAIKAIMKHTNDQMITNIKNKDGLTSMDFVQMHKSQENRQNLMILLMNTKNESYVSKMEEEQTIKENIKINDNIHNFDDEYQSEFESNNSLELINEGQIGHKMQEQKLIEKRNQLFSQKDIEKFIKTKEQNYHDEFRLGNFNHELYCQIYYGQTLKNSVKASSSQQINQILTDKYNNKIQRVEQIFASIDESKKNYLVYQQIMNKWSLFEEILDQMQLSAFQSYLERFYKDTKITKSQLVKIMNFYIYDQ